MVDSRILLIARKGQLGWELERSLAVLGEVIATDYPEIDLESADDIRDVVRKSQPRFIVNAAAYTAVDNAEKELERALKVNAMAPGLLAEEAKRIGAVLIHYSTDYVFGGKKGSPYTESDPTSPLNVYGKSKLEGEKNVQNVDGFYLIFRTSWVYSLRQQSGFVSKVLQWSRQQEYLKLVTDQVGNPTWARMLAEATAQLIGRGHDYLCEHKGLYHLAGSGFASRFEWGRLILELDSQHQEQTVKEIQPSLTGEFPTPATRPLFSALDCSKFESTFGLALPDWKTALRLAMDEPK